MATENPLWGVPRIHGEIKKLGFDISQSKNYCNSEFLFMPDVIKNNDNFRN